MKKRIMEKTRKKGILNNLKKTIFKKRMLEPEEDVQVFLFTNQKNYRKCLQIHYGILMLQKPVSLI